MSVNTKLITGAVGAIVVVASLAAAVPAQADDAGAFVGGMLTSRILGNMGRRTQAEEQQAQAAQQQAQQGQQAAPAPAAQTAEQKLAELDKLASAGYITPQEYKTRREAILNSL